MTIDQSLDWAKKKLSKTKTTSPILDSEVLLSFVLKKPKEHLYSYLEKELTQHQLTEFKKLIHRRTKYEPVAYLINKKEFYGLGFYVDRNVLIPRPETELLIEETLKRVLVVNGQLLIIDVGTGSGCIAIALAKHVPRIKIYATDISKKALRIAKKNAKLNGVEKQITFLKGNLLESLLNPRFRAYDSQLIIVANLPYLTTSQWRHTSPDIKLYEPRQALNAGPHGLKYFREFFKQLKLLITNYRLPITLILEIDLKQTKLLRKLIKQYFPVGKIQIKKDLAGLDRLATVLLNVFPGFRHQNLTPNNNSN